MSKPSVLITLILLMILMLMSFEYGHMQHRLNILEKQLKVMKTKEMSMNHQMNWLRGDVNKVKRDEKEIKEEEKKLHDQLKKEEAELQKLAGGKWDENENDDSEFHEIHMKPLMPHFGHHHGGIFGHMMDMMHGFKAKMHSLVNKEHQHDNEKLFGLPKLAMFQPPIDIQEITEDQPQVENISITIGAPAADKSEDEKKLED